MNYLAEQNDCTLHCRVTGSGPALLLIHGVACDGSYFDDAAELLKQHFTVITYDRRGYHERPVSDQASFTVAAQAEDARLVLRQAGFEKAYVAGCSAGGLLALELALKHPEMVDALFIHEPPLGTVPEDKQAIDDWLSDLSEDAEKGRLTKALIHFYRAIGGTDPSAPSVSLEQQAMNLTNLKVFLYRELPGFLDYIHRLPERLSLDMPVTLAVGTEDLNGIFSGAGAATARRIGAKLLEVPGFHNLPAERPETFADILRKVFL